MWMELQFSGQWVGEQVADQVVGAQYVGSCGPGLWWLGVRDLWKGQEPAFQFTIWIPVSLGPWLGVGSIASTHLPFPARAHGEPGG